jgi:hypothetical protein
MHVSLLSRETSRENRVAHPKLQFLSGLPQTIDDRVGPMDGLQTAGQAAWNPRTSSLFFNSSFPDNFNLVGVTVAEGFQRSVLKALYVIFIDNTRVCSYSLPA